MKIFTLKGSRQLWLTAVGLALAITLAVDAIGTLTRCRYLSVLTAAAQANDYEVRSQLLMEAVPLVGACRAEEAVRIWAGGLIARSAAMQYIVMTQLLQQQYAAQLERSAPNWVTGISSPWVSAYVIDRAEALDDTRCRYELTFSTETSTGPAGDYKAALELTREGHYWRISRIETDEGLIPYTRYNPNVIIG